MSTTPSSGVETTTRKTRDPNGGTMVEVYQTMRQAGVDAIGSGDANSALASYGVRPMTVRR